VVEKGAERQKLIVAMKRLVQTASVPEMGLPVAEAKYV
jgi:hypothetical protein